MDKYENLEKIKTLEQKTFRLDVEGWVKNEFLTWEWWVLVAFFVIPWLLWIKYADRTRLLETSLFGAVVMIVTTILDNIGMVFEFWMYPTQFLPVLPRALPFDMSLVPVVYMFIYQYFQTWKSFSMALLIMSGVYAFIGEPLSIKLELVQYIHWKFIYSFLYYIIIGWGIRWVIVKFRNMSGETNNDYN